MTPVKVQSHSFFVQISKELFLFFFYCYYYHFFCALVVNAATEASDEKSEF